MGNTITQYRAAIGNFYSVGRHISRTSSITQRRLYHSYTLNIDAHISDHRATFLSLKNITPIGHTPVKFGNTKNWISIHLTHL